MTPIAFSCEETLPFSPEHVAEQILDVENWSGFAGYGFIPGIKSAQFEVRTPDVVGSRIRVTNSDGSGHVEEIVEWRPDRLSLHMKEFSAPLSRLAAYFEETWEFGRRDGATKAIRSFKLHPKSAFTRPFLWLISFFFKRAIARHLRQMKRATNEARER